MKWFCCSTFQQSVKLCDFYHLEQKPLTKIKSLKLKKRNLCWIIWFCCSTKEHAGWAGKNGKARGRKKSRTKKTRKKKSRTPKVGRLSRKKNTFYTLLKVVYQFDFCFGSYAVWGFILARLLYIHSWKHFFV